MWNNIKPNDRIIRFILGTLCVYGGIVYHPYLAIPAIALFISVATNSCAVYKMMGLNHKLEKKNYYLSVLPKYNPEPVLIFCNQGKLLFRNDAAHTLLPNLTSYEQLNTSIAPNRFIAEAQEAIVRYIENTKTYQFSLKGNTVENFIMVYGFDISLIVEGEEKLRYNALHDSLTQLQNRTKLLNDLQSEDEHNFLALIDIKNFGQINGFYSHEIGDRFLQSFSSLLREFSHQSNTQIYRVQSDIFAVLGLDSANAIELITTFFNERYIMTDGIQFALEITVAYAQKTTQTKQLLSMAETALIEAKRRRVKVLGYDELGDITQNYLNNLEWSKRIKHVLAHEEGGELIAFFQPIQNTQTGLIEKYETLARIVDKENIIPPLQFLDTAKQLGLLPKITLEILRQAFEKAQNNIMEFSINITTQDLQNDHFPNQLITLLQEKNILPSRIVLELLEEEEMYEYLGIIGQLKAMGFKVAIDDFGTGYSNFAKLQQIEVDYIKIDGSLIKTIDTNHMHLEVVRTINRYAHSIGAKTIAEFVSTQSIAQLLIAEKIDYLQGYAIGQPTSTLIC